MGSRAALVILQTQQRKAKLWGSCGFGVLQVNAVGVNIYFQLS